MKITLAQRHSLVSQALLKALSPPEQGHELSYLDELGGDVLAHEEDLCAFLSAQDTVVIDLYAAFLQGECTTRDSPLQLVLKALKNIPDRDTPLQVIAISSLLCWNSTPSTRRVFKERHFKKRACTNKYLPLKAVETVVLSLNEQENVCARIAATGCVYGQGEEVLHDLFRSAWMLERRPESTIGGALPIIDSGSNVIPTIHVDDLAVVLRSFITQPSSQALDDHNALSPYAVVVDRGTTSQAALVKSIACCLGGGAEAVYNMSRETIENGQHTLLVGDSTLVDWLIFDASFEWDSMTINEILVVGAIDDESGKPLFKCAEGFVANIEMVKEELIQVRMLHPVRVWVQGSPGSGCNIVANALGEKYSVPVLRIGELIEEAKNRADILSTEIAVAMETATAAMAAVTKNDKVTKKGVNSNKKSKNTPGKEEGNHSVRLSAELLAKIVHAKCCEPKCRNAGFILDSYPRTQEESMALFYQASSNNKLNTLESELDANASVVGLEGVDSVTVVVGQEDITPTDDTPSGQEGCENDASASKESSGQQDKQITDTAEDVVIPVEQSSKDSNIELEQRKQEKLTCPTTIVRVQATESECQNRCKHLTYAELQVGHNDLDGISRRWARYNSELNQEGMLSVLPEIEPIIVSSEMVDQVDQTMCLLSLQIERRGFYNYHPTPDELAEVKRKETERVRLEEETLLLAQQRSASDELARQEVKIRVDEARKLALAEEESLRIAAASAPLRSYLLTNVIPALVEGLTECCKTKPQDPVEFLSEFLFSFATRERRNTTFQENELNSGMDRTRFATTEQRVS